MFSSYPLRSISKSKLLRTLTGFYVALVFSARLCYTVTARFPFQTVTSFVTMLNAHITNIIPFQEFLKFEDVPTYCYFEEWLNVLQYKVT